MAKKAMAKKLLQLFPQSTEKLTLKNLYLYKHGWYSANTEQPIVTANFLSSLDGRIAIGPDDPADKQQKQDMHLQRLQQQLQQKQQKKQQQLQQQRKNYVLNALRLAVPQTKAAAAEVGAATAAVAAEQQHRKNLKLQKALHTRVSSCSPANIFAAAAKAAAAKIAFNVALKKAKVADLEATETDWVYKWEHSKDVPCAKNYVKTPSRRIVNKPLSCAALTALDATETDWEYKWEYKFSVPRAKNYVKTHIRRIVNKPLSCAALTALEAAI